ncbi:undecaprenyl diphosphate synthase family protein, partial [Acinetobacter baumannii]
FIGDRSRLPSHLVALMEDAEQQTAHHDAMTLTIAVSYGGMWDIANAAKQVAQAVSRGEIDADQINVDLFEKYVSLNDLPAVDLLIRTGGDFRISSFLLWQAAYAE